MSQHCVCKPNIQGCQRSLRQRSPYRCQYNVQPAACGEILPRPGTTPANGRIAESGRLRCRVPPPQKAKPASSRNQSTRTLASLLPSPAQTARSPVATLAKKSLEGLPPPWFETEAVRASHTLAFAVVARAKPVNVGGRDMLRLRTDGTTRQLYDGNSRPQIGRAHV